ncbi:MAG: CHAT domain-containing protein, partial [Pseudomonadota bacterium]
EKLRSFNFEQGRYLADILLDGVIEPVPEGEHLIVVPDDVLGILPFEVLVLDGNGTVHTRRARRSDQIMVSVSGVQFLGDRNTVSYWQSLTARTNSKRYAGQGPNGGRTLVIADPVFGELDERWRGSEQATGGATRQVSTEARSSRRPSLMGAPVDLICGPQPPTWIRLEESDGLVQRLSWMYGPDADIRTGLAANKRDFLDNAACGLDGYAQLVFAGHGYFGNDLPGILEPVLVFSLMPPGTDGYLRMSEVTALEINADVVALAACRSGLGEHVAGEGVLGMGRAFQYAGAKSVLVSLWPVAVDSSVHLIANFFAFRKGGRSKLDSLTRARFLLRESGYDHPYFWASFILVGEVE